MVEEEVYLMVFWALKVALRAFSGLSRAESLSGPTESEQVLQTADVRGHGREWNALRVPDVHGVQDSAREERATKRLQPQGGSGSLDRDLLQGTNV